MLKNLQLDRALCSIDCETTGLLRDDPRILEIAIVRVHPSGHVDALCRRLNPGMPIPIAATAVHGITDEMVADCPSFGDVLHELVQFVAGCDVSGFNFRGYDAPVIDGEVARLGRSHAGLAWHVPGVRVADVMELYHAYYPPVPGVKGMRTLRAAYRHYLAGTHCAHGALADALAAVQVLDAMIRYHTLPPRVADLVQWMAGAIEVAPELSRRGD